MLKKLLMKEQDIECSKCRELIPIVTVLTRCPECGELIPIDNVLAQRIEQKLKDDFSKKCQAKEKGWEKAEDEKTINSAETNENIKLYDVQSLIAETCDKIKGMLLDKNSKYGNSALSPKRIFSKAHIIEQINVRMDDKLSRISVNQTGDSEDAEWDLLGYLVLKRIALKIHCLEQVKEKKEQKIIP